MSDNKRTIPAKFFYVKWAIIAFALNWIWEIAQMSAYRTVYASTLESLIFCTLATVIDVVIILAIYGVAAFLFRRQQYDWRFYLTAALLGAISAILFEKVAFAFDLWSYNERMPVVPIIKTGLFPFVQLTTLAPLTIWLATKLSKRRGNSQ